MMKKVKSLSVIIALMLMITSVSCDDFLKIVTVKTLNVSDLTSTSTVLNGQVTSDGGGIVTERGFFYSTSKSMKNAVEVACGAGGEGNFEATISGLQPNTKYYFQAFASSADDMDVGETIEFTTYELGLTVTTLEPEIISSDNIILKGHYENKDALQVTKLGFEYSKNGDFSNSTVEYVSNISADFSLTVSSLEANSNYYYRAFAETNDTAIIVYGESVIITTSPQEAPALQTLNAEQITATSANLNASIPTDYSGDINSKGFYWSTNQDFSNPSVEWVGAGLGTGSFSKLLENLSPSTTYYFRAFVTYANGDESPEVLGEIKSFTTLSE